MRNTAWKTERKAFPNDKHPVSNSAGSFLTLKHTRQPGKESAEELNRWRILAREDSFFSFLEKGKNERKSNNNRRRRRRKRREDWWEEQLELREAKFCVDYFLKSPEMDMDKAM